MMKKLMICIILAAMLLLCGCGTEHEAPYKCEGLDIVTTVFPAYDFARNLVGEHGTVTLLVPPGAESHSFEPTPQDIIRINNCDLLICNGGESEAWLEEIAEGLDSSVRIISMLDCVDALEEEIKEGMQHREHAHDEHHEHDEHDEHDEHGEHDEHHEHEEHHEHDDHGEELEYDEHVWTSPVNAARICRAISDELCAIDPVNSEYYTDNTREYCSCLEKLDEKFREICDNSERNVLIFADRFPVRYFVEEYGLDYYAAFPGCADDAEPSARTVAFLIDRVRENDIPAVLFIEFSNEKMADVVCEDTGCRKLLFHSCHNVSSDELMSGISYLELMERNLETVKEALS